MKSRITKLDTSEEINTASNENNEDIYKAIIPNKFAEFSVNETGGHQIETGIGNIEFGNYSGELTEEKLMQLFSKVRQENQDVNNFADITSDPNDPTNVKITTINRNNGDTTENVFSEGKKISTTVSYTPSSFFAQKDTTSKSSVPTEENSFGNRPKT